MLKEKNDLLVAMFYVIHFFLVVLVVAFNFCGGFSTNFYFENFKIYMHSLIVNRHHMEDLKLYK